jgi:signal transduction histidine kinase
MSTAQSAAQRAVQSTAAANGDMVRLVHDLRQPLGVLIGYINLLLDHPGEFGDDDRTAMLGEMRTAAARLDGMLHGMVASDDEMP